MRTPVTLHHLGGTYTIYRLPPGASAPAPQGLFHVEMHSPREITVIRPAEAASPSEATNASGPWSLMAVGGIIPHDATGVLAGLSAALSGAGIPIFAISTFDTDYLLVPANQRREAEAALTGRGYRFESAE